MAVKEPFKVTNPVTKALKSPQAAGAKSGAVLSGQGLGSCPTC